MNLVGMNYGIGRHVYYLGHDLAVKATRLDWLAQAFVITALTIGKISVAFFILRLSNTRWHTWFLHTVNMTLIIINIPLIVLTYAQCKPAALLWDPSLTGYCWDPIHQGTFAVFQGCKNCPSSISEEKNTDFPRLRRRHRSIIRSLSHPYNLEPPNPPEAQSPPRKHHVPRRLVSLPCPLLLLLTSTHHPPSSAIAGAVKTYYLQQLRSRADFTYDATQLMIWYTTEMYVIIIAGSLPTLRPLAQRAIAASKNRTSTSRKGYQQYPNTPDNDDNNNNSHPLKPFPHKAYNFKSITSNHKSQLSGSDQNILPPVGNGEGGITKTTDIRLDYGMRRKENERGHTMDWENAGGDDAMGVGTAVGAVERV